LFATSVDMDGINILSWPIFKVLTWYSNLELGAMADLFPHLHMVDVNNLKDISSSKIHNKNKKLE
jgi:hypothetical protein